MSDLTEQTASIVAEIKDNFESRRFLHGHRESVTESLEVVVGVHVFDTIDRLTRELAEARDRALEEAADAAYRACAETRHVTLGDKAAAAIRALKEKP